MYRVIYLLSAKRALDPALSSLEAAKKRRKNYAKLGFTAWVEDEHGNFTPVLGALRKPRHL